MKRDTAELIINEDYGRMLDLLLNTECVKQSYHKEEARIWIDKVEDEFLREGLGNLSDVQLHMIEGLIFDDRNVYELAEMLGMKPNEVYEEIQDSRNILLRYI